MFLECKQLFDIPGEKVTIDYELDLSDYTLFSGKPFRTPIQIKGVAENRAEIVSLNMTCSFQMALVCDRCLEDFERTFSYDFSHVLMQDLNSDVMMNMITSSWRITRWIWTIWSCLIFC